MRFFFVLCVLLLATGCFGPKAPVADRFVPADEAKRDSVAAAPTSDPFEIPAEPAAESEPATLLGELPPQAAKNPEEQPQEEATEATLKPLTEEEQEELLGTRLEGGLGDKFRQFANMFLVKSHIDLGIGVGLMTSSKKIMQAELQPVFPDFYEPTLREFLDAIAMQSFSQWKYDPSSKYFKSGIRAGVKRGDPVSGIAIFEFTEAPREKPYSVTLAEGWKAEDKGHWQMYIPPEFPVGLDIYEVGVYSAEDAADSEKLFKRVRAEVSRQWAGRVSENVAEMDFRDTKVGSYDALYYEAMIPSQFGKKIRWRQWVFMVDNKCYFVVSTIFPELEEKILPDVKKMLASFRAKAKAS